MDVQTVSIAVGLVVSLLFAEVFGLAAGGMIVPGYVALSMNKPLDVAITIVAALITFGVVRLISKFAIIYGRRRIVMMILVGFLVGSLMRATPAVAAEVAAVGTAATPLNLSVIGFIIPGLIALWIDRQGLVETVGALVTSAVVVRLVLIIVGLEVLA
jgi:poly-gamma-glutamate biosynthesis protein PgsC/CapC